MHNMFNTLISLVYKGIYLWWLCSYLWKR